MAACFCGGWGRRWVTLVLGIFRAVAVGGFVGSVKLCGSGRVAVGGSMDGSIWLALGRVAVGLVALF